MVVQHVWHSSEYLLLFCFICTYADVYKSISVMYLDIWVPYMYSSKLYLSNNILVEPDVRARISGSTKTLFIHIGVSVANLNHVFNTSWPLIRKHPNMVNILNSRFAIRYLPYGTKRKFISYTYECRLRRNSRSLYNLFMTVYQYSQV